jgi:signal transduction histidine kinase
MQPPNYHPLLLQQITASLGDVSKLPASMQPLLQHISTTYQQFDEKQLAIEAKMKLRTDQLVASTSRAYSFLDSLNMGFIMCDISAEVVVTNQAVQHILSQKMTGTTDTHKAPTAHKEWNIATIDGLLQPELELKKLIVESLATNKPLEAKETNFGKRVLHLFIAPMVNEVSSGEKQQIGVVILVEDITEQKVLERSKDDFLSIASHELRTPLTAIRGNASLIKKYYGDKLPDEGVVEMIDDIHESAIRLIDIVNDFLDATSLEQGKMQMNPTTFSLSEVITEVIREFHGVAESKGLSIVSQPEVARAPSVSGDKQRIKQVLYNLIGNALKFTDKGTITISVRTDEQFVYTTVSDTGKGMPPENQRLLFGKFQQAGNSILTRDGTKGTGLGLYISKLIMEHSGGSIGLEHSEVGKGSSFVFSLPRAQSVNLRRDYLTT